MRLLVTGGRDYRDRGHVYRVLDAVHAKVTVSTLIHGAATGADSLAAKWAEERGVRAESFPADWTDTDRPGAIIRKRKDGTLYDALAGHVRNQRMIDEGKPDGVVAFPGGTGTADMVDRARKAELKVWDLRSPPH